MFIHVQVCDIEQVPAEVCEYRYLGLIYRFHAPVDIPAIKIRSHTALDKPVGTESLFSSKYPMTSARRRKSSAIIVPEVSKARSTLATMSKQHCRSNRQLCCLLLRQCCRYGQQCRSNIRHCSIRQCCFDIVAGVDRA